MAATRHVLMLLALSLVQACSSTYGVGHRELTASEYSEYREFVAECENFRRNFGVIVTHAIKGQISSGELQREFDRRPAYLDFECTIDSRAVAGPQPRDEDYIALLEARAQASYEREKAKEVCGEPSAADILLHFTCVGNYVTHWRDAGQAPIAPTSYVRQYKQEKLSEMSFERLSGIEYYAAMKEAEERLAKFEFLYVVRASATKGFQDRLESIDRRLSVIERRL
jgi:hypothetical protein